MVILLSLDVVFSGSYGLGQMFLDEGFSEAYTGGKMTSFGGS